MGTLCHMLKSHLYMKHLIYFSYHIYSWVIYVTSSSAKWNEYLWLNLNKIIQNAQCLNVVFLEGLTQLDWDIYTVCCVYIDLFTVFHLTCAVFYLLCVFTPSSRMSVRSLLSLSIVMGLVSDWNISKRHLWKFPRDIWTAFKIKTLTACTTDSSGQHRSMCVHSTLTGQAVWVMWLRVMWPSQNDRHLAVWWGLIAVVTSGSG